MIPTNDGANAVVYTDPGLQGDYQSMPPGRYDTADLTVPNDSIRSVAVPQGLRVTVFEHSGFTGDSAVIDADTQLLGANLDCQVSSVIVETI
ncbi:hypothetical protein [Nocardia terpenica]|uniref:Beta/gamma crystallin 'Greek key' domain-containing protein n=1 Tax=Nocardia terpenica TaxID=455432 RepID=A0A6G9YWP9_9NOCA|nr:hypothetical protein [Nocardia terpenica]QIS17622.1 hypothetical protein F6W96_04190 [Nocardia terpenica]